MGLLNFLVHHTSFFAEAHNKVANINGLLRAVCSGLRVELQNYGVFAIICGPQELHIANNLEEVRQWIDENTLLHDVPVAEGAWNCHRIVKTFTHQKVVAQVSFVGAQLIVNTESGSYLTVNGHDEDGGTSLLLRFRNA